MADGKSARRFGQMDIHLMDVDAIERVVATACHDIAVNSEKLAMASYAEGVRCAGMRGRDCKYSRRDAETRIGAARMEISEAVRELSRRARGCE